MTLTNHSNTILEAISQPWHWSVAGAAIALILLALTWLGRSLGISTSFESFCAISGVGKRFSYFNRNLKDDAWRLALVAGVIGGGFIATQFLASPEPVAINPDTLEYLATLGITYPESDAKGIGFVPTSLFNISNVKGLLMAIAGGFLVGFGSRYAGGCTSGHAITGLAHLQLPSLLSVIGFFIGGIVMTWVIFPWLISL